MARKERPTRRAIRLKRIRPVHQYSWPVIDGRKSRRRPVPHISLFRREDGEAGQRRTSSIGQTGNELSAAPFVTSPGEGQDFGRRKEPCDVDASRTELEQPLPARATHITGLRSALALSVTAATVFVMARHVPTPFSPGSIEEIAKIIGELYSGSELTRILNQVGLPDSLGSGMTKWKRLAVAMLEKQGSKQDGGAVVGLIHAAMAASPRQFARPRIAPGLR